MIQFALTHPNWDPTQNHYRNLEEIVNELLGFSSMGSVIGETLEYAPVIASRRDQYQAAAAKWFELLHIAHAFARFIVRPAASSLLPIGICWLFEAARSWDQEVWNEHGVSYLYVKALHSCWDHHRAAMTNRSELQVAFQGKLNLLTATGFPGALALAEHVAATA
jgi:hypothetical protein